MMKKFTRSKLVNGVVSASLPRDVMRDLDDLAYAQRTTKSSLIRKLIIEYVAKNQNKLHDNVAQVKEIKILTEKIDQIQKSIEV